MARQPPVDRRGDRSPTRRRTPHLRRPLGGSTDEVLRHIARLWGFTVRLEAVGEDGKIELQNEIRGERHRHHGLI